MEKDNMPVFVGQRWVIEINDVDALRPFKGTTVHYIIVKKELKEQFEASESYYAIIPMLSPTGKILYV